MEVNGRVEAVSAKPRVVRGKSLISYSVLVNGTWYGFGFSDPKLSKGDNVSLFAEQNPRGFWDAKVLKKEVSSGAEPEDAGSMFPTGLEKPNKGFSGKGFPIGAFDYQRSIVRQNAITNARELVMGALKSDNLSVDDLAKMIVGIARTYFEPYTTGDADLEEAQALVNNEPSEKKEKRAKKDKDGVREVPF